MSEVCPECGAPIPAARPGTTVACPRCRNPVLVPGDREPAPLERATPSAVPAEGPEPSLARWGLVALALAVIAVAHLGLWLLLCAGARAGVARAEDRYDAAELEQALAEADVPLPPGAEAAVVARRQDRLETARAWANDRKHAGMVGYALLGAFLLQAGVVVLLKLRSARPRRERATRNAG